MVGKLIDGIYHYDPQWLEDFHKRGREFGDAGIIPVSFDGKYMKYECYGTIDNPCKELHYLTMIYDPIWDGPLEAEEPKHGPTSTYEFIILDFGENGVD